MDRWTFTFVGMLTLAVTLPAFGLANRDVQDHTKTVSSHTTVVALSRVNELAP